MNTPAKNDTATKTIKSEFLWLFFGIPIGCGIGIAIKNLALGVGIGMLCGATIMVFRVKKDGRSVGALLKIALVVCLCAALFAAVLTVSKK
jgi:hypothetical protein